MYLGLDEGLGFRVLARLERGEERCGVVNFDKIKHDQNKLKQDIAKREKRRKGGDGMDGDGDGVLDACMHQARSSIRGRERYGEDPLKDSSKNSKEKER